MFVRYLSSETSGAACSDDAGEDFITDGNRSIDLTLDLEPGKKKYQVNGKVKSITDVKGTLPAVSFTPDDLELVAEYEWYSKIHYRSRSTGLLYNHDFAKGVPLEEVPMWTQSSGSESIQRTLANTSSPARCFLSSSV